MNLLKMIKTLSFLKDKKMQINGDISPRDWAIKNFNDPSKAYLYFYYKKQS